MVVLSTITGIAAKPTIAPAAIFKGPRGIGANHASIITKASAPYSYEFGPSQLERAFNSFANSFMGLASTLAHIP